MLSACGRFQRERPTGLSPRSKKGDNYLARPHLDAVGSAVIAAGNGGQEGAPGASSRNRCGDYRESPPAALGDLPGVAAGSGGGGRAPGGGAAIVTSGGLLLVSWWPADRDEHAASPLAGVSGVPLPGR